ncbi:hypothetical protein CO038_03065 [Candidatus Pacearchaeota archaeon CG_4_9_14_0_2_um_filter_39_13]|nr:hypothetical protein [Candidatus Pacearchaeota archaeon]OIO42150.1 MAG: hypothetical protein AUJ64_04240 [Candidatus Pacearchaeota archaeon CG1_02_39_14]PJC44548.1 MAG: hypothetical protein CO038_03065 [Candidatus Pacearchaeota archaeon CG_4_9_14_0_2_um_filter_39_13]
MDKRGAFLFTEEGVRLFIAAIVIAILIGLAVAIISIFTIGHKIEQAKEALNFITYEINANEVINLRQRVENVQGPTGWTLTGYDRDDEIRPENCGGDTCLCICSSTNVYDVTGFRNYPLEDIFSKWPVWDAGRPISSSPLFWALNQLGAPEFTYGNYEISYVNGRPTEILRYADPEARASSCESEGVCMPVDAKSVSIVNHIDITHPDAKYNLTLHNPVINFPTWPIDIDFAISPEGHLSVVGSDLLDLSEFE